jgi:hypothetical protein
MNQHKDANEVSEHLLQLSFLQFLQVVQSFDAREWKMSRERRHNHPVLPDVRLDGLVRKVEICEEILARIPDHFVNTSPNQFQIRRMERNFHELVKFLGRIPYTDDLFERERLVAGIEKHIQAIRGDYWEAMDWFETEGSRLPVARKEMYDETSIQMWAAQ